MLPFKQSVLSTCENSALKLLLLVSFFLEGIQQQIKGAAL
jgi:hypothetical protein